MKTAAIYVRCSSADQHVESQLYDLRELAAQRGYEVVQEYRDAGVSGKRARRPGLDALIVDARRKRFSVVLVAAFDRVARSVKHFLQVMDEFDSLGIVFVSRRENIDTSGPMGRLFLTLIGIASWLTERGLVTKAPCFRHPSALILLALRSRVPPRHAGDKGMELSPQSEEGSCLSQR